MLAKLDEFSHILRCPITGAPVRMAGDHLVAESSEPSPSYPIVNGLPLLVDFDQSVLQPDVARSLASSVPRPEQKGLRWLLTQLVSPPNRHTATNVLHLRTMLADKAKPRVLVIGGGTVGQGLQTLYQDPNIEVISFDIYGSQSVQFIADAHQIPLLDGSCDAVVIQAVLEHVIDPHRVVQEIGRVLAPQGLVYAETPFLQHVHEGAYDFTRFTESGHRHLFRQFDVVRSGSTAGAGTQLLWAIDYFVRGLTRSRALGKCMKILFFWLIHLDRFIPEPHNSDAASGVFFMGRKSNQAASPKDIIRFYRGAQ